MTLKISHYCIENDDEHQKNPTEKEISTEKGPFLKHTLERILWILIIKSRFLWENGLSIF